MVAEGNLINDDIQLDGDESTCQVRDSYAEMAHGLYALATLGKHYYRPIDAPAVDNGDSTTATFNETIDASVFHRWRKVSDYRPQNLVESANLVGVDPAQLDGAVLTGSPGTIVQA